MKIFRNSSADTTRRIRSVHVVAAGVLVLAMSGSATAAMVITGKLIRDFKSSEASKLRGPEGAGGATRAAGTAGAGGATGVAGNAGVAGLLVLLVLLVRAHSLRRRRAPSSAVAGS